MDSDYIDFYNMDIGYIDYRDIENIDIRY